MSNHGNSNKINKLRQIVLDAEKKNEPEEGQMQHKHEELA
jgi:hypothetical protein